MRYKRNALCMLLILCLLCGTTAVSGSCQDETGAEALRDCPVLHETEFGGVYITVTIDEFNALGYQYGDSVDIAFSNGYSMEDQPYYNGYYTETGHSLLVAYPGYPYIRAGINYGDDLWILAGLSEGDTAPYDYQVKAPTQQPSPNKTNSGDGGGKNGSATIENKGKQETTGSTSGYWDNGNHKKKKLWPWMVGAGVAVIILIAVIASGRGKETPIDSPIEEEQPIQPTDENESLRTEISNEIALANQLLEENQFKGYQDPTLQVQGLNKGWGYLNKADSLNLGVKDNGLQTQIDECRDNYVTRIAGFYAIELDNWVGLNEIPRNNKDLIEQSESRMHQVESFNGIEKVFEKVPEVVVENLANRDMKEESREKRKDSIMALLESRKRNIH